MTLPTSSRRRFLKTGIWSGAALLGLGEMPFLRRLGPVSAQEAEVTSERVRFRPEIEPWVRLIEETPRGRVLEEVGERVRRGLAYNELMAALLLAGVRNIRPGPVVGAKLHAVLVIHSAHLASLASPPADRWLPLFWAIDEFKHSQARDIREGDWTMPALDDSRLPPAERASAALDEAIRAWDTDAADRAMAVLARTKSLQEIYEQLWRYGARDYLHIGHKAIYVANSCRTLRVIGPRHAEGVLRSLARALVVYNSEKPPTSDSRSFRPAFMNQRYLPQLKEGWQEGRVDPGATRALLATFREGTSEDAAAHVVRVLNSGISVQSVWDALFTTASEQILRRPTIFSLHAQTHTNAMRFAFGESRDDKTRRFIVLQNAAFMPMFRVDNVTRDTGFRRPEMAVPGDMTKETIDAIRAPEGLVAPPKVEAVFAELGRDRRRATLQLLAGLEGGMPAESFMDAARYLLFLKGDDPHDYKYSTAILEDYEHVSPPWRNRFLAANLSLLRSSTASPDNPLTRRIRGIFSA